MVVSAGSGGGSSITLSSFATIGLFHGHASVPADVTAAPRALTIRATLPGSGAGRADHLDRRPTDRRPFRPWRHPDVAERRPGGDAGGVVPALLRAYGHNAPVPWGISTCAPLRCPSLLEKGGEIRNPSSFSSKCSTAVRASSAP